MQVGQRLGGAERAHLGHEGGEQVERAVGLGDERGERAPPVAATLRIRPVDQRPPGGIGTVGCRQPGQRQVVAALIVRAFGLEPAAPLAIN